MRLFYSASTCFSFFPYLFACSCMTVARTILARSEGGELSRLVRRPPHCFFPCLHVLVLVFIFLSLNVEDYIFIYYDLVFFFQFSLY